MVKRLKDLEEVSKGAGTSWQSDIFLELFLIFVGQSFSINMYVILTRQLHQSLKSAGSIAVEMKFDLGDIKYICLINRNV